LGGPRGRRPLRSSPLLAAALIALAVFLPLFDLTLLAVLVVDQVLLRRGTVLRAWFNVIWRAFRWLRNCRNDGMVGVSEGE
jgi:uncharacterized membrane protein YcfT